MSKVLHVIRDTSGFDICLQLMVFYLVLEYSGIKEDQGCFTLWPCSGPLTRFLQDSASSQRALWTGTHKVCLPPFPQSPNAIPAGFALSNSPHALFPGHLVYTQELKIDDRRKEKNLWWCKTNSSCFKREFYHSQCSQLDIIHQPRSLFMPVAVVSQKYMAHQESPKVAVSHPPTPMIHGNFGNSYGLWHKALLPVCSNLRKSPENYSSEELKIHISAYIAGTPFMHLGRILPPPAAKLSQPLYSCEVLFKEECEGEEGYLP